LHGPVYPSRPHVLTCSPASDLNSGHVLVPFSVRLTRSWHAYGSPPQADTLTAPFGPSRRRKGDRMPITYKLVAELERRQRRST
jgi:hypothetical protein